MSGWSDFFDDVLENTPHRRRHVNVIGNIHPDKDGNWIWHISMERGSNFEQQKEAMIEMIKTVGINPVHIYEGGIIKKLIHMTRPLSDNEIERIPKNALNLVKAFEQNMIN